MAFKIKTFKILILSLLISCGEQNEENETSNGSSSSQTDSRSNKVYHMIHDRSEAMFLGTYGGVSISN